MANRKKHIDWDMLKKLAEIFCTINEIVSVTGISEDTLSRRCKKEFKMQFGDWLKINQDSGKRSLRRKMYELAIEKNSVPMAIWLSKNVLGYRDQPEESNQSNIIINYTTEDPVKEIEPVKEEVEPIEEKKTN